MNRIVLEESLRELVRAASELACSCEKIEHNEGVPADMPSRAAERLRCVALKLSQCAGISLAAAYARRIREVEKRSLLRHQRLVDGDGECMGADVLSTARTWSDIQVGQAVHDRQFHPDVFGLSKAEQLRHYTFHITKLCRLLLDAIDSKDFDSFTEERLADIAIFGVKIATTCNVRLPDSAVDSLIPK